MLDTILATSGTMIKFILHLWTISKFVQRMGTMSKFVQDLWTIYKFVQHLRNMFKFLQIGTGYKSPPSQGGNASLGTRFGFVAFFQIRCKFLIQLSVIEKSLKSRKFSFFQGSTEGSFATFIFLNRPQIRIIHFFSNFLREILSKYYEFVFALPESSDFVVCLF